MVSIILPVFNSEDYLEDAVYSVLNQSYSDFELIIINDGSTDKSSEICNRLSKEDNRIIVFHKENEGVSSARNIGIENAKGEYVLFLDADDCIHPKTLEITIGLIEITNVESVIFKYEKFLNDYHPTKLTVGDYEILSREEVLAEMFNGHKFRGLSCNKLYPSLLIKDLKFRQDKKYGEDSLFTYNFLKKTDRIVFLPEVLYYYRQNPYSALNKSFTIERLQVIESYVEIVNDVEREKKDFLKSKSLYALNVRVFEFLYLIDNNNVSVLKRLREIIYPHLKRLFLLKEVTFFQRVLYLSLFFSPDVFWKLYLLSRK